MSATNGQPWSTILKFHTYIPFLFRINNSLPFARIWTRVLQALPPGTKQIAYQCATVLRWKYKNIVYFGVHIFWLGFGVLITTNARVRYDFSRFLHEKCKKGTKRRNQALQTWKKNPGKVKMQQNKTNSSYSSLFSLSHIFKFVWPLILRNLFCND